MDSHYGVSDRNTVEANVAHTSREFVDYGGLLGAGLRELPHGTTAELVEMSRQFEIDRIVVALPHSAEKRLLEMVAGGHALPGILEALCELVESTASGCYCSVVLVDPSGTRLEHGAAPSLPASFIDSVIDQAVNVDSGPCAMSARRNEQVIAADLAAETRWAAQGWGPMALAAGRPAWWGRPRR